MYSLNFDFRFAIVYVFVCSADSPSIVKVHLLTLTSSGGIPLLRTNIISLGVTFGSNKCGGVSALIGLSFNTIKPLFFPEIVNGDSSNNNASGINPFGKLSANTILLPNKLPSVTRLAFLINSLL